MTAIVIDTITIRQGSEGRFCLNDLHKAAGGEKAHQPSDFLRQQKTQELITELSNSEDSRSKPLLSTPGRFGGTYVCKELIYAYAMWISPQFHLKVIRAYDRLATRGVAVHESAAEDLLKNPLKYMREVLDQAEKIKAERDGLVDIAIPESAVIQLATDV
ncbi:KilA-N domain-containing protein [Comamonas jiangduensis]|uniref:KilA-N domain-containing protein n=1 Tax=Comamonas jiangduensis TaxID=1194168 RepID=UPI003BF81504|nr:KilA-N domain-containing protein [Comamonas sp.]